MTTGRALRLLPALLACLLCASRAQAAFEDLGSGARATGLGNAFTALADDLHAHHYNPAGLGGIGRSQFNATYSRLHMGLSDESDISISQLAYIRPLKELRWGTLGVAWHQLSLAGLYSERSVYLSYGKMVWDHEDKGTLFAGASLKNLNISFNRPDEAGNAFSSANPIQRSGRPDPVLSGSTSKSVFDADLGLLYRYQYRYFVGLAIKHLNEPDLAFSSSDSAPLRRAMRLGAAYKALWMNLTSEVQLDPAPGGGQDKTFIAGAERYFPTLRSGQFGLRGAMAFGSRDFRQISMGVSYRVNKIQFDYSVLMPLGTIKSTIGTHRLGLTFHFGAPTPQEQYTADLFEKIKTMEKPAAAYAYEFEGLPTPIPAVLTDAKYDAAKSAIEANRFKDALEDLTPHLRQKAAGVALVSLGHRLEEVAEFYPVLDAGAGPWAEDLAAAIKDFLYGRDAASVLKTAQAWSLDPKAPRLDSFLTRLEAVTKRTAERVPPEAGISLLDLKLNESETLFVARHFDKSIKLCEDILVLRPNHPTALARIGSAHYVQNKHNDAMAFWNRALQVEKDPTERETLKYMLIQAQKKLKQAAEAAKPKPAKVEARPKPAPKPAPKRSIFKRRPDPQAIEKLYQYGVELYSRGEWRRAAAAFQKILELEPGNTQAQRAVRRLEGELMLREGRP
ncbi:MAG: type IX secretion system membrane protein PorP/SprF [Elusimicrobiota bacterium]